MARFTRACGRWKGRKGAGCRRAVPLSRFYVNTQEHESFFCYFFFTHNSDWLGRRRAGSGETFGRTAARAGGVARSRCRLVLTAGRHLRIFALFSNVAPETARPHRPVSGMIDDISQSPLFYPQTIHSPRGAVPASCARNHGCTLRVRERDDGRTQSLPTQKNRRRDPKGPTRGSLQAGDRVHMCPSLSGP